MASVPATIYEFARLLAGEGRGGKNIVIVNSLGRPYKIHRSYCNLVRTVVFVVV